MDMKLAQKALDKAKVALMSKPDSVFFTTVCFSLKHVWDDSIPTAQTNGLEIRYNPEFFMQLRGHRIAAHNSSFEEAVLESMGFDTSTVTFIDTAVMARANGFGGSLEAAAPQALDVDKMEAGKNLIKLFGGNRGSRDLRGGLSPSAPVETESTADRVARIKRGR